MIRSPNYERQEFKGSGLTVNNRRLVTFSIDLISRLIGLVAAVILFLRRPKDPIAVLFCVVMLFNGFPVATRATMWPGLGGVLVVAIAQFGLVVTGLLFPHGKMRTPWQWLALGIAVISFYKDLASNMDYWTPIPLTEFTFDLINLLSLTSLLVAIISHYYRTPQGLQRQQFKPVAFGTGIWIVFFAIGILLDALVHPALRTVASLEWQSMIEWACFSIAWTGLPVGLLVGLSRYRLYDADSAISQSIAYLGISMVLIAVFACADSVLNSVGRLFLGHDLGVVNSVWGALVSAAMIKPVQQWLTGWMDRRVRGGLIELRDDLPNVVNDMRETESTTAVAHTVLAAILKGVHSQRSAIVVGGKVIETSNIDADETRDWLTLWSAPKQMKRKFDRDPKDAVFPLRVPLQAGELAGWLLVGPRPDKSLPDRQQRDALVKIAKPTARAIHITLTREARERERSHTIDALVTLITDIQTRFETIEERVQTNRGRRAALQTMEKLSSKGKVAKADGA